MVPVDRRGDRRLPMNEREYTPVNTIAVRCPRCRFQFTTPTNGDKFRTYCGNRTCYVPLIIERKGKKGNKWKVSVE